ncbi:MAG: hypothetical protein PF689_01255 [Deltaproteobacteria bacterium]|jgi:hypothetical protein|nr:hypothetical protein [Deltaproteobacteria bacterium]
MYQKRKFILFSLAAVLAVIFSGCAEERAPRSYVQPHVMAKTDFTGEWYYAPTVVDIGYSSTVTFIGETSMDIAIVYWDIEEDHIFARLAYDRIDGAETNNHEMWEGEIIGAWSIKHLDIIREYNSTTGEEINVIKESSERPWYEREFIRIDWTKNQATSWAMMWPHYTKIDPVGFSTTDPNDPDYPKYVRENGGELTYIGITDKVIMAPEMRDLDGWDFYGLSQIPDCYFYGSITSCNSSQIKVRHAFWKKDPDKEYESRIYKQTEHDRFGYFMTNVLRYNRQYGVLIQEMHQYANRWNFFNESFKKATTDTQAALYADVEEHFIGYDDNGDPLKVYECPGGTEPCRYIDDNTKVYVMGFTARKITDVISDDQDNVFCPDNEEDERGCFYKDNGQEYIAATPNWWEIDRYNAKPVTLKYSDRKLRPMVYYLNKSFPDTLWGVGESGDKSPQPVEGSALHTTIKAWADAHNMWLDFLSPEIRKIENDDSSIALWSVMVCPYIPADTPDEEVPYAFGSKGTIKCEKDIRRGDFRKPQLNWVDEAQLSSPLGYGPPLPDPRTGESISAAANIYGEALDGYIAYQRDIVRMLTDDDFPWSDYLIGDLQATWVDLNRYGTRGKDGSFMMPKIKYNWQRKGVATPKSRIKELFKKMDTGWAANLAPDTPIVGDQGKAMFRDSIKRRLKAVAQTGAMGDGTGAYTGYTRLNSLRNTTIEDRLMTPQVLLFAGTSLQAGGVDPTQASAASLPYGSELRAKVSPLTTLNVQNIRTLEKIKSLHRKNTVLYAEVPYVDPNAYGIAKEMVDTLCGGTWDGSYGECGTKIYNILREKTFIGVTIHEMGHNMGLRHNFKGTFDAMNFFDEYWEIREHDGTVGPRTADPITQYEIENRINDWAYSTIMDYNGNWNGDFKGLGKWDYAAINYGYGNYRQVFKSVNNMAGIAAMQEFTEFSLPTPLTLYNAAPEALHYTAFKDYTDLSDINRDWVPQNWIEVNNIAGVDVKVTNSSLDPNGTRYMVPFMHCSDEFRNLSLGCNLFDQGADLYEITEYLISRYENNYILNNFSRGSYTWGWDEGRYQSRIVSRYFDILQNHAQYYMLWLGIFYDYYAEYYGIKGVDDFFADHETGWGGWTLAVADIFSTFMRVLTMPQPGYFTEGEGPNGEVFYKFQTEDAQYTDGTELFIPLIAGKYIDDSWDFDWGYEWYLKILRRGQFFDRPLAIQMMAEATNNFLGRDTQEDFRKYTLNFARIYPNQIMDIFGAIQDNNLDTIAPKLCGTDTSEGGNPRAIIEHPYAADLGMPACASVGGTLEGYIDPNNTFSIQLYAATLGMAMFPMNYSQSFIDKSRIYVEGNGEGIDWSHLPPENVVQFTDPFSKKIFYALKYDDKNVDGYTANISMSARMINRANVLLVNYEDAVTAYNNAGGDPEANEDEYNLVRETERYLLNYIDNLEMVRGLTRQLEFAEFTAP